MKPISTPDAPAAIGTYSQAVRAGDTSATAAPREREREAPGS